MSEIVKKLAALTKEAVNSYVNDSVPLEVGIAKIASREDLTADQIKRLVESSNTLTWLSTVKPSMDKTAEFSIASYHGVMSKLQGKTENLSYDVDGTSYDIQEDPLQKVASEVIKVESTHSLKVPVLDSLSFLEKKACQENAFSSIGKAAARHLNSVNRSEFDLKCLYQETKSALSDTIEKLASKLSSVYAEPFSNFEKRAYSAVNPTSVKPVIDLIFDRCSFDKQGYARVAGSDIEKYASFPFYHDDDKMVLLKEAMEYLNGMIKLKNLITEKSAEYADKHKKYSSILKSEF